MDFEPGSRGIIAIVVVAVVLFAAAFFLLTPPERANPSSIPTRFAINGKSFAITYVAINETEWELGLMNKKITNTTTMLFIFPNSAVYSFWMHDVNSSLDIIWLSVSGNEGHVVYLVNDVPGCSFAVGCPDYTPTSSANYVIEAQGGFAAANGVTVGTAVEFS